ncbi:hypothetical protein [Cesiribacter sp. SM1]|uniref:hypothetical protein n=1 Tax=Cesiribacter sp. SM1 TaxID=2861196 RepID=UPI001CD6908E|nr:hypothetical protein [Cesiribacter sp. SM1]
MIKFAKKEFTERVVRLEKLLEEDFSALATAVRNKPAVQLDGRHSQKIVEQLQYHDIIRQKIQHVGEFAEVLETEFALYGEEGDVCVLPGLLELSMALLQFARLEYDEVRQEIQVQLIALSLKNIQHEENYNSFQSEIQEMIKSIGRMYLQIESPNQPCDEQELSAEKLRKICQSFSMQTEREIFRSLFDDLVLPEDLQATENESSDDIELF